MRIKQRHIYKQICKESCIKLHGFVTENTNIAYTQVLSEIIRAVIIYTNYANNKQNTKHVWISMVHDG